MTTAGAVLMSVRSPHVERILDGTKSVELRRRTWSVSPGTVVLLYASRAIRGIVGSFVVARTEIAAPHRIWRTLRLQTGITKSEFDAYFEGAPHAVAIHIRDVRQLAEPLPLAELRRRHAGFSVPQSYRYVHHQELAQLLNGERRQLLGR